MKVFLANILLYGPPLLCTALYFFKERKKQAAAGKHDPIMLFLMTLLVFVAANTLWNLLVMAFLSAAG